MASSSHLPPPEPPRLPPHTITKPPLARLSPARPLVASESFVSARHPDLVRPPLGQRTRSIAAGVGTVDVQRSLSGSSSGKGKSRASVEEEEAAEEEVEAQDRVRRTRSNSITTLKSLLDIDGEMAAASSSSSFAVARKRRSSGVYSRNSLIPLGETGHSYAEEEEPIDGEGASLDTWSTSWWPFKVTSPAGDQSKGKGPETDLKLGESGAQDSASRGLLELFAGRGIPPHPHAPNGTSPSDTNPTSANPTKPPSLSLPSELPEADETPPHFLDAQPSPSSKSSSPISPAFRIQPLPPLEGPAALFSAFALPNPFAGTKAFFNGEWEIEVAEEGEQGTSGLVDDDSHMAPFSIIQDSYDAPKYPLVLCHGIFGFDTIGPASIKPLQFSYWVGVKEALEAMGAEVLIGKVPASAGIEERARVLCEQIEAAFPGKEVNLIGHSMGGLDCRFLISRLKPRTFKIKSLTTIATPHRGASFADYMLEDVLGAEVVPKLLGLMSNLGVPGGGKAFADLTTKKMARFNDETPDDSTVAYFSYGAQFEPSWGDPFRMSWSITSEREGPNDGLVSVESSKWGDYRATLNNVNHMDLVGWVDKIRFGIAEWRGKAIKFKPVAFYCHIAEVLANEGF